MRVDITAKREQTVLGWSSTKPYKKLSSKVLELLQVLKENGEMARPVMFRAADRDANPKSKQTGYSNTDMTDFRMFATGLISMRATGVIDNYGTSQGVITCWTITQKGLDALEK